MSSLNFILDWVEHDFFYNLRPRLLPWHQVNTQDILYMIYFPIADDLTKVVQIGQLTEVIGIVRKDVCDEKMTWTIEVYAGLYNMSCDM